MVIASLPCTPVPSELDVPPGRWHRRMWVSDEPVEFETYWRCVDGFPESGLWPVLVPLPGIRAELVRRSTRPRRHCRGGGRAGRGDGAGAGVAG